MTRPTPMGVWKDPRPVVESNCLPFSSGWPGVRNQPVYLSITQSAQSRSPLTHYSA